MRKKISLLITLIICLSVSLFSCSSKKSVTLGSFAFDCPSDIELTVIETEKADAFKDVQSVRYVDEKEEYERTFFVDTPEHLVFQMDMIWVEQQEGVSLSDLNNARRSDFLKNDTWTVLEQIEEKEDSIILRAAPYKEDIRDMGIYYIRYYKKGDGIGYINLLIREDAEEKYRDAVEMILKTMK